MKLNEKVKHQLKSIAVFAMSWIVAVLLGVNIITTKQLTQKDQQIELLTEMLEREVIKNIQENTSIRETYLPIAQSI